MSVEVVMPKLGFSMTEGDLVNWLVEDGGKATEGSPLFLIESDKSSTEVESPATGTLRILKPAAESYEVGTVLAKIT